MKKNIRRWGVIGCLIVAILSLSCRPENRKAEQEVTPIRQDTALQTGAERTELYFPLLQGKRVALVANQTSVLGKEKIHLLDTLLKTGMTVQKVFAPEHGFRGEADAGETIRDGKDSRTGTPVVSLYGKNKKPSPALLQDVDYVVFDLQDVGARFYTYLSTLHYVMQACAENRIPMLLLDRPNPCDTIDGPVMQKSLRSFVGMHCIPGLHGCTLGELARMINGEGWLETSDTCRLTVIPVKNWQHGQPYLLPVKPSPNLPNAQSIALYASLCPFEATTVSVGRGTVYPFQVVGSPDYKNEAFSFQPTASPGYEKNPMYRDKKCYGLDLRNEPAPRGFSLKYLLYFYHHATNQDTFFTHPHFFDQLIGNTLLRQQLKAGKTEEEIRTGWQTELQVYRELRQRYVLYPHLFPTKTEGLPKN